MGKVKEPSIRVHNRHDPLTAQMSANDQVERRAKASKKKPPASRNMPLPLNLSHRILTLAKEQQDELRVEMSGQRLR